MTKNNGAYRNVFKGRNDPASRPSVVVPCVSVIACALSDNSLLVSL